MKSTLPLLLLAALVASPAAAMPLLVNETTICADKGRPCAPATSMKYERIVASQPGFQWGEAGGYCGSWAIQRATLAKGAWISQQQPVMILQRTFLD